VVENVQSVANARLLTVDEQKRRIGRSPCSLSNVFHSVRNAAARFSRSFHVQYSIFLALQFMVVYKKLFQLLHELLAEFFVMADVGVTMIRCLDGDDSVVALPFFLLPLPTLDDSDEAAFQQAAGRGGLVHQHEHVRRIAVFGFGRRNEAEVVREGHPGRQRLFQSEDSLVFTERVFVSAALGRSIMTSVFPLSSVGERSSGPASDPARLFFFAILNPVLSPWCSCRCTVHGFPPSEMTKQADQDNDGNRNAKQQQQD
jgi:hypothetical protein